MAEKTERADQTIIPGDLPEDMRASYKPRSIIPIPSGETDSAAVLQQKLDSQQLTLWRVVYGDERDTGPMPPPHTPVPGTVDSRPGIILNRIIGKGGFGEIWEATQTSLGRVIAVKRMKEDMFQDTVVTDSTARQVELSFRQEALTAASLDHPNIVPLHDLGRDEKGRAILSMKLVRGRPWDEIMDEDRPRLPSVEFLAKHLQILIQMTQAVGFAHSRGIVHRDLKPGQVMVGEFGEVLLMDWGLAVVFDREKARVDGSTFLDSGIAPTSDIATNPAGTIVYMAPEQTDRTAERIGPWTDLFLLGGTLYTILTNTVLYKAPGNVAAFYKAMRAEIEAPTKRAPDAYIPAELERICLWALEPTIEKRLQCARTFIRELQAYLTGATRRSEAEQLLEQAEELYLSAVSYESYGRAMLTVERAAKLWPENKQIYGLQQKIVTAFANMALRNEDLILARIQAQRIADSDERDRVTLLVEQKEAVATDAARQKNFFRRVTALSVLVMIISLGMHYFFVLSAREELETSNSKLNRSNTELVSKERALSRSHETLLKLNEETIASRERAEELVSFLTLDLSRELARLGRVQLIETAATPLMKYYQEEGARGAEDVRSQRNRVNALVLEAMVDRLKGRPEAISKLEEAADRVRQLITAEPENEDHQALLVKVLMDHADALTVSGDDSGALAKAREAGSAAELLLKADPDDLHHQLLVGEALSLTGRLLQNGGDYKDSTQFLRRAEALLNGLSSNGGEDHELMSLARLELAKVHVSQGMADWETGQAAEGIWRIEEAKEIRQALLVGEPWNMSLREGVAQALMLQALMQFDLGDFAQAEIAVMDGLAMAKNVREVDGSTLKRRIEFAYLLAIEGVIRDRMGNREGALEATRAAVRETIVAAPGETDDTPILKVARALTTTALAMVMGPETPEGQAHLREAVELFRENLRDPAQASTRDLHWFALALILTRDPESARYLELLAERGLRRRLLYEAALAAGLVEPSTNFSLRVRKSTK